MTITILCERCQNPVLELEIESSKWPDGAKAFCSSACLDDDKQEYADEEIDSVLAARG